MCFGVFHTRKPKKARKINSNNKRRRKLYSHIFHHKYNVNTIYAYTMPHYTNTYRNSYIPINREANTNQNKLNVKNQEPKNSYKNTDTRNQKKKKRKIGTTYKRKNISLRFRSSCFRGQDLEFCPPKRR